MRILLICLCLMPAVSFAEWRDVGPKEEARLLAMQDQLDDIEQNQRDSERREFWENIDRDNERTEARLARDEYKREYEEERSADRWRCLNDGRSDCW